MRPPPARSLSPEVEVSGLAGLLRAQVGDDPVALRGSKRTRPQPGSSEPPGRPLGCGTIPLHVHTGFGLIYFIFFNIRKVFSHPFVFLGSVGNVT